MNHYIFLQIIHGSGGVQCYVAAKAKWLEENGWHVVVISNCKPNTKQKCLLQSLNKYIGHGNVYTGVHPSNLPIFLVKTQLNKMIKSIGPVNTDDIVIVESWNSPTAQWAELLAARLHGRHLFWAANEIFRGSGNQYEDKLDFYRFKMERGEVLTTVAAANRLFDGYRRYKEGDFSEYFISEDPIRDVHYKNVDNLIKKDWNICYIGRAEKPYVPNVIKGIELFSKRHPEKSIQFILVGDANVHRALLDSIGCPNLTITELGDLYPLPSNLYEKIDVVIAGSGSARHSVDEGALVISTDTETCRSHGILGYDTQASIYVDKDDRDKELDLSFEDAIERALVTKEWRLNPFVWKRSLGISESVALQERIMEKASPFLEYYDDDKLLKGKLNPIVFLRIWHGLIAEKLK